MIRLPSTLTLQAVMGAAKTTNEAQITVSYQDTGVIKGATNVTLTNGNTAVTAAAAPGDVGIVRTVDTITFYNNDTVAQTLTLQTYDGTNTRILVSMSVAAADCLCYENGVGFYLGSSRNPTAATFTVAKDLVALAGGAQAGTPLTADINHALTVATGNDSFQLPAATAGRKPIYFENAAAANSCKVFPQTGEIVGNGAANAGFVVAAGKGVVFHCAKAGRWAATLSA